MQRVNTALIILFFSLFFLFQLILSFVFPVQNYFIDDQLFKQKLLIIFVLLNQFNHMRGKT